MSLTKEATAEALRAVPIALRAQSAEIQRLRAENAALLEKVASNALAQEVIDMMEDRGTSDPSVGRTEKVAMLLESGQDLGDLKRALLLQPQDMSFAKVASKQDTAGEGTDAFTAFLLGQNR